MKTNFKFYFIMLSFLSSMFLISSSSWLSMWIWLEINLISFIAYMFNNKTKLIIESSLIYFLIQTMASILLLFSIITSSMMLNMNFFMIISILIKLGSAPFHFWVPMIIESLNWMKIFFLLTIQKINPLIMLNYYNYLNFLYIFIIFSMIIGSISGLNFSSLKKMISFSSINQLSWLMMSILNNKLFKIYLSLYFFIMISISMMMNYFNLNFINQIFNLNNKLKFFKLFIFMNFLSLGGLPPFLGFFPKMIILSKLNNLLIMFLLIMFSLIMLFMYIRIIFSMIMLNSVKINKIYKMYNLKIILLNMNLSIINNFLLMYMCML